MIKLNLIGFKRYSGLVHVGPYAENAPGYDPECPFNGNGLHTKIQSEKFLSTLGRIRKREMGL